MLDQAVVIVGICIHWLDGGWENTGQGQKERRKEWRKERRRRREMEGKSADELIVIQQKTLWE